MKKRILLVCLALTLILSLSVTGMAAGKFRVAMVTDVGGLGDKSFNDAAYDGLKMLQKQYGAEIKVVESSKMEDYVPNLKSLADQKFDVIWAIGFLMQDALTEVAKAYPDQHFGIIDAEIKSPNVRSVLFKEHEGSFLVGVIAAMDSKKHKVGFVGGMEFPLIKRFEAGYRAGVKAANPKTQVFSQYAGAFDNPTKGKELAASQFAIGADIIYHAAGATGLGVIAAAKEKGEGYWAIGVDKDQYAEGLVGGKSRVIASMIKRVDVGVLKTSVDALNGKFSGGTVELGLKEDGVGVSESAKKTASKKALAQVERFKKQIIAGKIKVPTDPKDVK
ncbi:nucleoside-binding protein [Hydrogenispora ethanolica]|uniref:Nucleoside-binding protein n=1 Tax=Hydrogenispora ethanolica TaxID=1082276 RepID=A0A4V2QBL2_HYDET|nr:BMP family ABC transporter substrate-binding protein [Hydrogenispora ethanolica]TCL56812.1 nucleoside-binding protein [Hydrogenispora ethanolica]